MKLVCEISPIVVHWLQKSHGETARLFYQLGWKPLDVMLAWIIGGGVGISELVKDSGELFGMYLEQPSEEIEYVQHPVTVVVLMEACSGDITPTWTR